METPHDIVFLLDVDNTLLDNDRVRDDFADRFSLEFGPAGRDRYWEIYEALRTELGYADYLGALQRFRIGDDGDPRLPRISSFMLDYPFGDRLYPGSLAAIAYLGRIGLPVILSDGDVVYQARKIQRSGLCSANGWHRGSPAAIMVQKVADGGVVLRDADGLGAEGAVLAGHGGATGHHEFRRRGREFAFGGSNQVGKILGGRNRRRHGPGLWQRFLRLNHGNCRGNRGQIGQRSECRGNWEWPGCGQRDLGYRARVEQAGRGPAWADRGFRGVGDRRGVHIAGRGFGNDRGSHGWK